MVNEYVQSDYKVPVHRKQTFHTALLAVLIVLVTSLLFLFFRDWKNKLGNEKQELAQLWADGSYEQAFTVSREMLKNKPMDAFLLTLHGFSAYQIAIAQINNFDTLTYIDTCIWSLRKALLSKDCPQDGRLQYVLGKAYFYKGFGYADLAVKFLEEARIAAYNAQDIPEYLGLAYAALHDYRNSVISFALALNPEDIEKEHIEVLYKEELLDGQISSVRYPSDLLFLSIARSYLELEEFASAQAYLVRCVDTSKDSKRIVTARLLLGDILRKQGDVRRAEQQYLALLEENGENAEAHFQLGVLYNAEGDPTRARAEWRKAVRIDPAHRSARERLNM